MGNGWDSKLSLKQPGANSRAQAKPGIIHFDCSPSSKARVCVGVNKNLQIKQAPQLCAT